MKTRVQKEENVKSLADKLQRMKSAVFVNFAGLKSKDIQKLREATWKESIDYKVVKKTLLRVALKQAGIEGIDPKQLQGNIGMAVSLEDEVIAPKAMASFAKEHEAMKILGGILEKKLVDAAGIKALANLPGKNELLAKLVGSINVPISGFVNVLAGNLRGLVRVLNVIKESKS